MKSGELGRRGFGVAMACASASLVSACCGGDVDSGPAPKGSSSTRASNGAKKGAPGAALPGSPAGSPGSPGSGAVETKPGESWGAPGISWRTPAAGLEEAKTSGKPVLVVVWATWCRHCKNYSKVFDDPRIAAKAKEFVMVLMDADKDASASKYQPSGATYVPRTMFLGPTGDMLAVKAENPRFAYFYDENNPGPLLDAMDRARASVRDLRRHQDG